MGVEGVHGAVYIPAQLNHLSSPLLTSPARSACVRQPVARRTSIMMKQCALLLLACVYAHAVPLEAGTKPGSCQDAVALGAAGQALDKINKDRTEGYVFGLHRLSNVNQMEHVSSVASMFFTVTLHAWYYAKLKRGNYLATVLKKNPVTYSVCKCNVFQ